jgi:hypothetical protein
MGGVMGPPVSMTQGPVYTIAEGGGVLSQRIYSGIPFVAGKLGTSEFDALQWFVTQNGAPFPRDIRRNMVINAGLFSSEIIEGSDCLHEWCQYMMDNFHLMDEIAMWNPIKPLDERFFIENHITQIKKYLPLRALEPFYQDLPENRWSLAIEKPFCVVSPFVESIENQWAKRDVLFPVLLWSSKAKFCGGVCTGYSPLICDRDEICSWPTSVLEQGWWAGVNHIVDSCVATGAKFVFVGAGALSLPVCFELKKKGISAIHTGGGTQIIFGIRGRRWLSHSVISGFFNEHWISPQASEIPSAGNVIEGGCYF